MPHIHVVLVEPKTQGNVGAIARSMLNFGAEDLHVVNPRCELGEIGRSRSRHAEDIYKSAKVHTSLEDSLYGCDYVIGTTGIIGTDFNLNRTTLPPRKLGEQLRERSGDICVLLGREDTGLTNEELELCDVVTHIPANPVYPVLNLSHAATIILYELFVTEDADVLHELPSQSEKEAFKELFHEITAQLRFRDDHKRGVQRFLMHRLLGKAAVTKRELQALFGFLRAIQSGLDNVRE